MAAIKLWYSPGACSIASHILLRETGVPFEAIKLDSKAGFPDEFRRINPKMRIPVLSIDDEVISETPAIMTAISQLCPDKHLMGKTDLETVREYELLNWLSGTLHGQGFGGIFRPYRFSDDQSTYGSIKAKSRKTVEECFDMIEQDLLGVYAVGGSFTAVDTFLYVFYRWGASVGMDMEEQYPKYTRLVVNLAKRQSVQAALKVEGVRSYIAAL